MRTIGVLLSAIFLVNQASAQSELAEMMIGSFSSVEQAELDSNYYDITLHMYRIWPDEKEIYLYVEQAVSSAPDRPYRQRVYQVSENEGVVVSAVFTIPDDSLYIGKWAEPEFFGELKPSDLMIREGCEVYMAATGPGQFKGSTKDDKCKSTLRGASYATSVVEVQKDVVTSWDQGFDKDGNQVWGATEGPYIFKRLTKN